jgi:hypothetical protein
MNRQTFGAQVVSKTLDYLNNSAGPGASLASVDKQSFGAAVVAKTLDYMNSGSIGNKGATQATTSRRASFRPTGPAGRWSTR